MPVKRNWNTLVVKRWVPLGNHCPTMAGNRTIHRVTLASHTDTAELHNDRTRCNSAAAGSFVANTDDIFHALPQQSPFDAFITDDNFVGKQEAGLAPLNLQGGHDLVLLETADGTVLELRIRLTAQAHRLPIASCGQAWPLEQVGAG